MADAVKVRIDRDHRHAGDRHCRGRDKFIVAGSTERTADGRLEVILEPAERALMLREMREFVVGLQAVTEGLARDDMKAVAKRQPRHGHLALP